MVFQSNFTKPFGLTFLLIYSPRPQCCLQIRLVVYYSKKEYHETYSKKEHRTILYKKNWRPITLLNADYKIAAKAIANLIKTVLSKLINNDQTGFMKGQFIGENIRLIDGIIQYATQRNVPGLLLFIDFEKAFDSLEWPFVFDR